MSSKQSLNHVGQKLRELRESRRLTLTEVAEALSVNKAYISRVETGQQPPSPGFIVKLSHYIGADPLEYLPHQNDNDQIPKSHEAAVRVLLRLGIYDSTDDNRGRGDERYQTTKSPGPPPRYRLIDNALSLIFKEYRAKIGPLDHPPIPVKKVANQILQLRIREISDSAEKSRGVVFYISELIYINRAQCKTEERARWTTAHECGHAALHAATLGGYRPDREQREREANNFAAKLLMPDKMVMDVARKLSHCTLNDPVARHAMSKEFQVSLEVMENRLVSMKLVERARVESDRQTYPVWRREEIMRRSGRYGLKQFI